MIAHFGFIAVSYALAFAVIAGMIGTVVYEHRRLRRELSRFEDHDA
jgi:heme exporter protein CcmD